MPKQRSRLSENDLQNWLGNLKRRPMRWKCCDVACKLFSGFNRSSYSENFEKILRGLDLEDACAPTRLCVVHAAKEHDNLVRSATVAFASFWSITRPSLISKIGRASWSITRSKSLSWRGLFDWFGLFVASFERFLFLLRLLGLDNVDFSEGRVIDQTLANATVADLTRLLS